MKKNIKKILKRIISPIAIKLGFIDSSQIKVIDSFAKVTLLETFFLNIAKIGFYPKHIIDVGANHGTWTRETLQYFPDAYYTLLEPQEWLKDSFQDLLDKHNKLSFMAVGAGEKKGSFKFTIVDRDDSCSFRYSEDEANKKGYKQIEVPIVTLNEIAAKENRPFPDLVKIDAEGLDLNVLKGASDLFGKTEVFLVEAGVVNKEFDNSFLKTINFMDEKGYRLFEITDLNRPFEPDVLWLVELAFVKNNGVIDSLVITL